MRLSCCCKLVRNVGVILFVGSHKFVSVCKNGEDRSCLNTDMREYFARTPRTLADDYLIFEPILYIFIIC